MIPVDFSPSAPPEKQFASVVTPANLQMFGTEGADTAPKNAVEFLNRAVQVYGARRQETDEGDGPTWPVIQSLEQLVQYRILQGLPAAPPGKKFVMDKTTKVVSLADQ